MTAEKVLERLDVVRDRGNGQWYARCPAHDDNGPSLSIKETADGTVLIHCFALCSPAEIVAAVGLELSDLFPEKLEPRKGQKPRWNPRDLLLVIRAEAILIACAAGQIDSLSADDLRRVQLAGDRIQKALGVANVR
ncbi:MAG: virulence-associated protein E [Pseudomonadales bacterium]|nr:virulence-associated protein E [Pseudomonadales bacterium]